MLFLFVLCRLLCEARGLNTNSDAVNLEFRPVLRFLRLLENQIPTSQEVCRET